MAAVLLAWGISLLVSLNSNFVPSPFAVLGAIVLSLLSAIYFAAYYSGRFGFGWDPNRPEAVAELRKQPRLANTPLRTTLMAMAAFGLGWMGLPAGLSHLITLAVGEEGSVELTVDGWERESHSLRSGHKCQRPTVAGVPPLMLGQRALCGFSRRIPAGTRIRVSGRSSLLGVSATTVEIVSWPRQREQRAVGQ